LYPARVYGGGFLIKNIIKNNKHKWEAPEKMSISGNVPLGFIPSEQEQSEEERKLSEF
jgi:hypothetical protein